MARNLKPVGSPRQLGAITSVYCSRFRRFKPHFPLRTAAGSNHTIASVACCHAPAIASPHFVKTPVSMQRMPPDPAWSKQLTFVFGGIAIPGTY